ncbi:MAG: hypothetical protein H8M99_07900 [Gloeobacteraceae cyanobacterium ES-bin-144]|nr:hypothetical protein [Verrucomicrobiales bacterium]
MNPRSLPMLNAIGCLVLAAVVFTQWAKEIRTEAAMTKLLADIAATNNQLESEIKRATNLERDIAVLKQSLEATQRAAIKTVENEKNNRANIDNWKNSIAERDEKIRSLNADLTSTRRRLDEAIVKLKQAAAR